MIPRSFVTLIPSPSRHVQPATRSMGNQRTLGHTPHPEPSQPRDMRHRDMKPKLRALWPSSPPTYTILSPPPTSPSAINKPCSLLPQCSFSPAHPGPFPVHTRVLRKSLTCKPPLPGSPVACHQWPHVCFLSPPPSLQDSVSFGPFLPRLAAELYSTFPLSQCESQLQLAVPLFGLLYLFLSPSHFSLCT